MEQLKTDLSYRLPTPLLEALDGARFAINAWAGYNARLHGDALMDERQACETLLTDLLVRAIHRGEDYQTAVSVALQNARAITELN